jgi:EmrB/QacA subfamily drug resistance transporter
MSEVKSKNIVLFIATVASFLPPFMGSAINIALPSIGDELGMDPVLLGWVATAYLLSRAIFLVPLGRAADIFGRKRFFGAGMVTFTLFSLLCAISTSSGMLIAFRFLQGIGSAVIFGTAVAILTSVFPPRERGKALGINVTAIYLALSAGPFFGGVLTQYLGWRSIFLITVPLGLAVIVLIFWKLEGEWMEAEGEHFDLTGSAIYSFMLFSLMYGLTLLPSASGGHLILLGMLGFIAFIWWEMKIESPVLNVRLFWENRVFALSNLAALINYGATFAVAFVLSLYLQFIKGLDPQSAGLILVSQPLIQAIFSPGAGKLSDRIEPRVVASLGMAMTALSLFAFVFLDESTEFVYILAALMVLGIGLALFSSPNTNAIMSSVEKRYYGVASGMVTTMRSVGMMTSMAISMQIFAVFMGRVQVTPDNFPQFLVSVKIIFIIFASLCVVGVFASLARGKVR